MKNLALTTAICLSLLAPIAGQAGGPLVDSLQSMELDASVVYRLSQGMPPSPEGIPGGERQDDIADVLQGAYTTSSLITKALDEARSLPMGQRIQHFQMAAANIIRHSGQNPLEKTVRMTLNRTIDVANTVITVAGNNSQFVAQWIANFYKQTFELALSFANNPTYLSSTADNVGDYLAQTSIAQYGFYYETMLWRMQSSLTSDSSKAIILIKLVGFLGMDFNMDLRRREPAFREVIADVVQIQKNTPAYKNILMSIDRNEEPRSADVAALRVKVYKLWSSLPARLNSTGLRTQPVSR